MPTLPDIGVLLVRTDFTDDDAWDQVREESTREYGPDGFRAYVAPVSDPQWAGAAGTCGPGLAANLSRDHSRDS